MESAEFLLSNIHVYLPSISSHGAGAVKGGAEKESSGSSMNPDLSNLSNAVTVEFPSSTPSLHLCETETFSLTKFAKELEMMRMMEQCVNHSVKYLYALYAYRSVSLAIPDIYPDYLENITFEDGSTILSKRVEYNNKTCEVLKPEIQKLRSFISYIDNFITLFQSSVKHAADKIKGKELLPIEFYSMMNQMIYAFVQLTVVYNSKISAFQTDILRYQHALGNGLNVEMKEDLKQLLGFYVHTPNYNPVSKDSKSKAGPPQSQITTQSHNYTVNRLRHELRRVSQLEDVLMQCILIAVSMEDLVGESKFKSPLVVLHLIYLAGSDQFNPFKANETKSAAYKQFIQQKVKPYPYIPVCYDLFLHATEFVEMYSHLDTKTATTVYVETDPNKVAASYELKYFYSQRREAVLRVSNSLSLYKNYYMAYPFEKDSSKITLEMCSNLYAAVKESIEVSRQLRDDIDGYITYKRMIKQSENGNHTFTFSKDDFSPNELQMLVDYVCMLKNLHNIVKGMEDMFSIAVPYYLHHSVEQLIGGDLVPLLHRLDKRNDLHLPYMLALRNLVLDSHKVDYKEYTRKLGRVNIGEDYQGRVTSLTDTRLFTLQMMMRIISNEHNMYASVLSQSQNAIHNYSKEVEKSDLQAFHSYLAESRHYAITKHYSHHLNVLSDMSGLWLREHTIYSSNSKLFGLHRDKYDSNAHVEDQILGMSVCVQVSVDNSLPYIMITHLLSNKHEGGDEHIDAQAYLTGSLTSVNNIRDEKSVNTMLLEKIIILLDVYNDAANSALHSFNIQVSCIHLLMICILCLHTSTFDLFFYLQMLYDEVEAEVTLVLDLIPLLLIEILYQEIKLTAIQDTISFYSHRQTHGQGRSHVSTMHNLPPATRGDVTDPVYTRMYLQKTVSLLGRVVQLSMLLLPQVLQKLKYDIDIVIRRFESSPVTHILDLQLGIYLLSNTHSVLASMFPALDSFDALFREVNEDLSLAAYRNRICMHSLQSLAYDILPNYIYDHHTSRFLPSSLIVKEHNLYTHIKAVKPAALHSLYGHIAYYKQCEHMLRDYRNYFCQVHVEVLFSFHENVMNHAVIIDQLTKHLHDKLGDINAYWEVLEEKSQKVCRDFEHSIRLARFHHTQQRVRHGSSHYDMNNEIFAYYYDAFQELLSYSDIKYELFQSLREAGHVFILLNMFSSVLEVLTFQDNLHLHDLVVRGEELGGMSPLEAVVKAVQKELLGRGSKSKGAERKSGYIIGRTGVEGIPPLISRLVEHAHNNNMESPPCLISGVLHRLEEHMYIQSYSAAWSAVGEGGGGGGFAKFLALLTFIFSIPPPSSSESAVLDELDMDNDEPPPDPSPDSSPDCPPNLRIFGHGLHIGGEVLLYLLGQSAEFDRVSINAQIMQLQSMQKGGEEADEGVQGGYVAELQDLEHISTCWRHVLTTLHAPRPSYHAPKGGVKKGGEKAGGREGNKVEGIFDLLAREDEASASLPHNFSTLNAKSEATKSSGGPQLKVVGRSSKDESAGSKPKGSLLQQLTSQHKDEDYLI